jgi:hypothetical protein
VILWLFGTRLGSRAIPRQRAGTGSFLRRAVPALQRRCAVVCVVITITLAPDAVMLAIVPRYVQ